MERVIEKELESYSDLMSEIIPYCSENFITIPLWEEGNYTIQLNLWYIIRWDVAPIESEQINDALDMIIGVVQAKFSDFEIFYERADRPVDRQSIIEFGISQVCEDILDENFVYDYNFSNYMIVATTLLKELKERLHK